MKLKVPALTIIGVVSACLALGGAAKRAKAMEQPGKAHEWSAGELVWKINNEVRAMVKAQEIEQARAEDPSGTGPSGKVIEPMPEEVRQANRNDFVKQRSLLLADLAALNAWAQRSETASSPMSGIKLGDFPAGRELEANPTPDRD